MRLEDHADDVRRRGRVRGDDLRDEHLAVARERDAQVRELYARGRELSAQAREHFALDLQRRFECREAVAQCRGAQRLRRVPLVLREVRAVASVVIFFDLDRFARDGVERDEPLRRRAEDDRVLAAPAVRVSVRVILAEEEHAALAHESDDVRVRLKHTLTREVLDFGSEATRVVNGAVDFESVGLADDEVVVAVARRCVN